MFRDSCHCWSYGAALFLTQAFNGQGAQVERAKPFVVSIIGENDCAGYVKLIRTFMRFMQAINHLLVRLWR